MLHYTGFRSHFFLGTDLCTLLVYKPGFKTLSGEGGLEKVAFSNGIDGLLQVAAVGCGVPELCG